MRISDWSSDVCSSDLIMAALAWWNEAGVDCDFNDEATDWLAEAPPAESPAPAANAPGAVREEPPRPAPHHAPTMPDLLGPDPPRDLAAFRQWWLSEPGLDRVGPRGRLAPPGEAGDRKSVGQGKSGSVRVDIRGRPLIKKK